MLSSDLNCYTTIVKLHYIHKFLKHPFRAGESYSMIPEPVMTKGHFNIF